MHPTSPQGPLVGIKVVEMAGIGPAPFCGMLLSDMGAEVIRIDRTREVDLGLKGDARMDILNRGKRSVALDLKQAAGRDTALRLIDKAQILIEGFRPGVMERLGLGPDICLQRNPRLIYGRMTGWGQDGPLAPTAGHDINYIALAGALHAIGRAGEKPVPPLNLVGDFGGGALYLAFGIVCALLNVAETGEGQVIDAAMIDGVNSLMTGIHSLRAQHNWQDNRGANILDTGAPYYEVYTTKDNKHISIGAIEGRFYQKLLELCKLNEFELPDQHDRARWPELKRQFTEVFKTKTRDEWSEIFDGTDVCYAPVLSVGESINHPHNIYRNNFVNVNGVTQPVPAPKFSKTPGSIQGKPPQPGEHSLDVLSDYGFSETEISLLVSDKIVVDIDSE